MVGGSVTRWLHHREARPPASTGSPGPGKIWGSAFIEEKRHISNSLERGGGKGILATRRKRSVVASRGKLDIAVA